MKWIVGAWIVLFGLALIRIQEREAEWKHFADSLYNGKGEKSG